MLVEVPLDVLSPVNNGGGGVVAASVLPQREGKECVVVVSNVPEGVVDGGELDGASFLG